MPNAQAQNYALFASNEQFSAVWKLTRAMKAAGWRYKYSSDGTTKDPTGNNPADDKWGGGTQVGAQTGTTSVAVGSVSTTAKGGRVLVTISTAAFVASSGSSRGSVGNYLTLSGGSAGNVGTFLITACSSTTAVTIENPNAVNETVSMTWTEKDAMLDSYPAALQGTSGTGAWWCAEGPATLKIPIGANTPTGTFIRGENVTQATSGATGEFMGVVTDTTTSLGYLVVAPRSSGVSGGVRGWHNTATITGDRSGATVSPTSATLEFIREVVFWKGSVADKGHLYYQVIESVTEGTTTSTTGRFSTMAALGTCTATICPGGASGGNPTTNGFPTVGTYVVIGSGGSGSAATGQLAWVIWNVSVTVGFGQILCVNNIEDTNVSPDASITFAIGTPSVAVTSFAGWGFLRLDDTEPGDVDPYVWMTGENVTVYTRTRTLSVLQNYSGDAFRCSQLHTDSIAAYIGTRRRGWATGDTFQNFQGWNFGCNSSNTSLVILEQAPVSPDRVACAFVNTAVREPILIASNQVSGNVNLKQRKGTLRWWYCVQGGNGTDTYDTKRWIQMSSSTSLPIIVGPADGTTVPANS